MARSVSYPTPAHVELVKSIVLMQSVGDQRNPSAGRLIAHRQRRLAVVYGTCPASDAPQRRGRSRLPRRHTIASWSWFVQRRSGVH